MRASLMISERGQPSGTIRLTGPVFRIGHAPDCQFRPRDTSVADQHCEFLLRGEELAVRDLGSVSGTLLNGLRIIPECRARARPGDRIQIGDTVLEVRLAESEESERPSDPAPEAARLLHRRLGREGARPVAALREDLAWSELEGVPVAAIRLRRVTGYAAVQRWREVLTGLAGLDGLRRVVLDLRSVEALSVEAVDALLAFHARAARRGVAAKLCEVRPEVQGLLEASEATDAIPTYLDAQMAVWSAWRIEDPAV